MLSVQCFCIQMFSVTFRTFFDDGTTSKVTRQLQPPWIYLKWPWAMQVALSSLVVSLVVGFSRRFVLCSSMFVCAVAMPKVAVFETFVFRYSKLKQLLRLCRGCQDSSISRSVFLTRPREWMCKEKSLSALTALTFWSSIDRFIYVSDI